MAERPPPKGRGALLESLRRLQQPGGVLEPRAEEPPLPRGRAALLRKYSEMRAKAAAGAGSSQESAAGAGSSQETAAGTSRQTSDVEEVAKSVQDLSITERPPVHYKGESGQPLKIACNFIRLNVEKGMGVFEHEVRFSPDIDAKNQRIKLVTTILRGMELVKVFDGGSILYLPSMIPGGERTFQESLPSDPETKISVSIIFKKKKSLGDRECLHLYNVLFKRIMYILMYTQMGRNYYDMNRGYLIPQHKLEVFPGFAVSVDELEGGLQLCLDSSHRVLRTNTCYELLVELRASDPQRFKERATSAIIGSVILTRYNNCTYIVDDIAWDMNPQDTFRTRDGGSISFVDYFKKQHNIDIKDRNQPLLINRKTVKVPGSSEKQERLVCLIPEISFLTGLTDELRNDFRVMKDVGMYTRITPHQRLNALNIYLKNLRESDKAQEVLKGWGLSVGGVTTDTHARALPTETIWFGGERSVSAGPAADWNRALADNKVTGPINLLYWVIFYTSKDETNAKNFADTMVRLGPNLGCEIIRPKLVRLPNDRNEAYMQACKENYNDRVQIFVFICPSMRNDRYSIIKRICCHQMPIPSQVINSRTLSNPSKVRSIIIKIALQINCKLGGTLWTIKLPFKGWMICGIDVYHSSKSSSVCGLVCSINESLTRYYSTVIFQAHELGDSYKASFVKSLEVHCNVNGSFPSRVVILRDGVGDGQLDHVRRHEIPQFEEVMQDVGIDGLCFIIVQKRINTKIFAMNKEGAENPPSGTVLDHTVTRRHLPDFFLVPQSVRQGTVNPTHYVVVQDTCNLKADHVQRLCYKLCHLYYNWPGTIRVPAVCQYAHKCAALAGQHVKAAPSPSLCDKLYYL